MSAQESTALREAECETEGAGHEVERGGRRQASCDGTRNRARQQWERSDAGAAVGRDCRTTCE
eukprot:6194042-Pleurochrysis_carterae.AAC.3